MQKILYVLIVMMISTTCFAKNMLNTDSNYSLKIAVTINEDDNIIGKLEYSNYGLQMVTFNRMGKLIHTEPYIFEIYEKNIISKNIHQIKCRSVNDLYGSDLIIGTIDFRDELHPKVRLVNEGGHTYVSNISEKGKTMKTKYIPNIWLGR